jgi:hypothetical protein
MRVEHITLLSYNSFFGAKLFAHFLSGCEQNNIRYELGYLVLPLLSQKFARDLLKNANSNSSLQTIFLDKPEGNLAIANIGRKIKYFDNLTRSSLIVAANDHGVVISDKLYISKPVDYKPETLPYIKEYYRSAHYLGKILSTNNLFDTFIKLGIREL